MVEIPQRVRDGARRGEDGVVVDRDDDLSPGESRRIVAACRDVGVIVEAHHAHLGELLVQHLRGAVPGTVVEDKHFHGALLLQGRAHRPAQLVLAVARDDRDRHPGILGPRGRAHVTGRYSLRS